MQIQVEAPDQPDIAELIATHLEFAARVTPPGHVHALDHATMDLPDVDLFTIRDEGRLRAIGALRNLGAGHFEIKSMHTPVESRGEGWGRSMLNALVDEARRRGASRVSLETGTYEAFEPARRLYESAGFIECPPFGDYWDNPFSVCMTLAIDGDMDAATQQ